MSRVIGIFGRLSGKRFYQDLSSFLGLFLLPNGFI